MINIELFENTGFFETVILNQGEVLFNQGDIDTNLYIIKQGELSIEMFSSLERDEIKKLAVIGRGNIIGEGSLSNSNPKEVRVSSVNETVLLKINIDKDFESFIVKHTKEGIILLSSIINLTNKRLLESNNLVTSSYNISKKISETTNFNNRGLFEIIDTFHKTIGSKYIIYVEKNPAINDYANIKYDTRSQDIALSNLIDLNSAGLDLEKIELEGFNLSENNYIEELINGNQIIGYLIIGNEEKDLSQSQKKSISSISVLIAGFIRQKQLFEESNSF